MDEENIQEPQAMTNADMEPEEQQVSVSEYNRIKEELQKAETERQELLKSVTAKPVALPPQKTEQDIGQEIFNSHYHALVAKGKSSEEAQEIAQDRTAIDMIARKNEILNRDLYVGNRMLAEKIEEMANPKIQENRDQIQEARKMVPEYDQLPIASKANILALIPKKPSSAPAIFVEPSKTKTAVTTKGTTGTRYTKDVEQAHNHDTIFNELLKDRGAKKEDYIARVNAQYEGRRK